MSTTVYEQMHTESLMTINFSLLTENFTTIDSFMKNFSNFERRFNDLQKTNKNTIQDLSKLKIQTQSNFSTINQVLESRSQISMKSQGQNQQMKQMKQIQQSFKEIKSFITQNTKEQHQAQQTRDKQAQQANKLLNKQIELLNQALKNQQSIIHNLQGQIKDLKQSKVAKQQIEQIKTIVEQNSTKNTQSIQKLDGIEQMLNRLNVVELNQNMDKLSKYIEEEIDEMKLKLKLKADYSDTLKLEEMLLNLIDYSYDCVSKKFAGKNQTKKALQFLERRINNILLNLYGDQDSQRDPLFAAKSWKCASCTKDLGEMEGKLDRYKPWAVFPTKQSPTKDRYSGFGAGFQTILQNSVSKKGVQVSYDQKGRMMTPFNLTRQVHGNLLKPSQSHSRLKINGNNNKQQQMQIQTHYMGYFGKNQEVFMNLKEQYGQKEKGLMAYINIALQSHNGRKK